MKKLPRRRAAFVAAAIAFLTRNTFAAAPPLTLEDALGIFRVSAFDLLVADTAVAAARAEVVIAGAVPNPALSLARGASSTYDPSLCGGCSNHSVSAGLSDQAISDVVSGRHRLREAVARAALEISTRLRADVERTLEFTLKQQVLQAELTKQSLAFARQAQSLATETFELTQKRYRAGAISEADVARADVQRLEAEQAVDVGTQSLEAAKSELAFLLGTKGGERQSLDVGDDLTRYNATGRLNGIRRDTLYHQALEHRPDLAAARGQIMRARSSIDVARRLRVPDFSASALYSAEGRGQSAIQPPTITLGISAPLPLLYRYRGEVARAESDLRTQEIARTKIETRIRADVDVALAAFVGARNRVDRMQTHLLPQAARARDLVRLQYDKGAASLFEFLDAQRTYLTTQNEYLQTLSDYWTAIFLLEQATGMELRQ
jgi:cobalt-zinc-cadmium efflux system outer membrane protein